MTVKCGVPQGSVLGPLIFNPCKWYHKFLSDTVLILSADDTNLFLSDKDIGNLYKTMNQELKQVNLWLTANKLPLKLIWHNSWSLNLKKRKLSHGEKVILNDHLVKKWATQNF